MADGLFQWSGIHPVIGIVFIVYPVYITAADARRYDMIAQLLESRQQHDVRELNHAVNEFRMLHQQPSSRREWDLYDPDGLKKDRPARVSDDDPRCGISSIQMFDGEDLNNKARNKFQNEQMREWAQQQMRERRQADDNQKKADRLYELKMRELDQRACELEQAEMDCRRAINRATKDYNMAQVTVCEIPTNSSHHMFSYVSGPLPCSS